MEVLKIVLTIINFILAIPSIYIGFFALYPFLRKSKKLNNIENTKRRFRFIIAARNEELVLKPLINSINNQNYDKDKFDIYVLPNNCTDNTKKIAIDMKCNILEPNFKPKTKGEVLNFVFDQFKKKKDFDTYIIMDADNVLDPNFLTEINNKLNDGYKVVQGFRDTKNLYQNPLTGSYALFFYLQSTFLYEARNRMGESAYLNGTGYAIEKSLIDEIDFHANTATEDIELSCVLALNKEKIGYSRSAIFYDEQVGNLNVSFKQRKRWIQGVIQVWKTQRKNLVSKFKEKKRFQLIDQFVTLTLPINQALVFPLIILTYFIMVPYYLIILGIIIGYLGEVIVSIFLTIFYKKKFLKMLPAILFFPIFHITWVPIYIYAVFNSNNVWEEIKHTKSLELEDILGE